MKQTNKQASKKRSEKKKKSKEEKKAIKQSMCDRDRQNDAEYIYFLSYSSLVNGVNVNCNVTAHLQTYSIHFDRSLSNANCSAIFSTETAVSGFSRWQRYAQHCSTCVNRLGDRHMHKKS
jgi:hypothetical protein